MTKRQEQIVRESFESVASEAGPLASLFYGRLFAVNPALRPMFQGDLQQQGAKLMSMLIACVDCLECFDVVRPKLRDLGRKHVGYGVSADHYPQVGAALLWSLAQALEQHFDKETRLAWAAMVEQISAEMQAGAAEHARVPHAG
jgi:hemoglobin-like flavoprotein